VTVLVALLVMGLLVLIVSFTELGALDAAQRVRAVGEEGAAFPVAVGGQTLALVEMEMEEQEPDDEEEEEVELQDGCAWDRASRALETLAGRVHAMLCAVWRLHTMRPAWQDPVNCPELSRCSPVAYAPHSNDDGRASWVQLGA